MVNEPLVTHFTGDDCPGGHQVLGPLQDIWNAWDDPEVQAQVCTKAWSYFPKVISIQFQEAWGHHLEGEGEKSANEVVDILSVCLNWLRWMGHTTPESVAERIRTRAANRYEGQAQAILDKYARKYGL